MFVLTATFCMGLIAGYLMEFYARINFENKQKILQMQEKLEEQAKNDYLTGLYNRRYFDEKAKKALLKSTKKNSLMSLIVLDIDYFKKINDTFGHAIGDEVIKSLAELLKDNTRKEDIISRFGGEEFVVLLPNTSKEEAFDIAEKLRHKVETTKLNIYDKQFVKFTISLGIDESNNNSSNISEIINNADMALYEAKNSGRNKTIIYTNKS